MTKGELIDLVHLKLSGGKLSQDLTWERGDVEAFLPAAMNYVITMYNRQDRAESLQELQVYGSTTGGTNAEPFLTTVQVTPLRDETRDDWYVDLPKKARILPLNRGIEDVFAPKGEWNFQRISSPAAIVGLDMPCGYYWYEHPKLRLKNLELPTGPLYVRYLVDTTDLDENDTIPMPAGLEVQVAQLMYDFFTGAKKPDYQQNDIDDHNSR